MCMFKAVAAVELYINLNSIRGGGMLPNVFSRRADCK